MPVIREQFLATYQYVGEGTHWVYTTTLRDKADVAIPVTALSTVTLTLMDVTRAPYTIINDVLNENIKNDGVRGVINAQGLLTLTLFGLDTACVSLTPRLEPRRARIEWVKMGSGDVLWKEIDFIIAPKTDAVP